MKPFWHSKTLWMNVAAIGVSVLGGIHVNPSYLAIANLVLRAVTTKPIGLTE